MISWLLFFVMLAPQLGTLEGYVFGERDGGPPLRRLTVELIDKGRAKHRETTEADGSFVFNKVEEGRYTIRVRFSEFVIVEEAVTVTNLGKNFAAVMLPKRWAGTRTFRAVTADQLAVDSNRDLQEKLTKAVKLSNQGDFAGAIRLYEKAAEAGTQADLWDGLGLLYIRVGRKDDAFNAFEKAIDRDPDYLLSYAHVGAIYLKEQRYKELLAVAKRALAIDSKWLTGHAFLGEALVRTGDLEGAQRAAETASQLARGRAPAPYLLLAKVRWARQDCAGARRDMERYLELNTSVRELPETVKSLEMLRACGPVQ
jgi:tetratricopeptide (TPR) repeat protein